MPSYRGGIKLLPKTDFSPDFHSIAGKWTKSTFQQYFHMYPDNFNDFDLDQLKDWRNRILSDLQQAQERALDAGVDQEELRAILSMGIAFGKVESKMQDYLQ